MDQGLGLQPTLHMRGKVYNTVAKIQASCPRLQMLLLPATHTNIISTDHPDNTRRWTNVKLMLVQRRIVPDVLLSQQFLLFDFAPQYRPHHDPPDLLYMYSIPKAPLLDFLPCPVHPSLSSAGMTSIPNLFSDVDFRSTFHDFRSAQTTVL